MAGKRKPSKSVVEAEARLLWGFLEAEPDACAVVSGRMELIHCNAAWQSMLPEEWFAKRCFEVFPVDGAKCLSDCPTVDAVNQFMNIVYTDEAVRLENGDTYQFGVGVIPVPETVAPPAKAILLLRRKDEFHHDAFREQLLADAADLRERVGAAL